MRAFRFYHVLIALAALAAYFTAEELGLVHAWLGYGVGLLIGLRLALGIARRRGFEFRRMIPRPGRAPLGQTGLRHPAIAHALTLALFICVAGVAGTGIAMDKGGTLVGKSIRAGDGEKGEGGESERGEDREEASRWSLIGTAYAEDGEREGGEGGEHGALGEAHELFGNLLLPLALAHAAYLLLFRFDLARFMLFLRRKTA
ncbi:MAG: cytochrome b/b6 domain-containing protein [Sphingomonadales bacterium]|nr:cytochrome b/b6 domain-containing protein [Sphingomonadales bacterium]